MRENSDARSTTSSPSATQLSAANGSDSVSALPSMPSLSSQVDESIPTLQALDDESSLGALPNELEPSVDGSAPMTQTTASTILPEPSEITSSVGAGLTSGTDSVCLCFVCFVCLCFMCFVCLCFVCFVFFKYCELCTSILKQIGLRQGLF